MLEREVKIIPSYEQIRHEIALASATKSVDQGGGSGARKFVQEYIEALAEIDGQRKAIDISNCGEKCP